MNKLDNFCKDIEYKNIVDDILTNEKFLKIGNYRHHGITRLEHSMRVSYYSYLITKKIKLNYTETARGGLLHDFFVNEDTSSKKQRFSVFFHPYESVKNSSNEFAITDMERDIIENHMFPTLPHKVPKYLESWVVSTVDKVVAVYEFYYSYSKILTYRLSNLYLILLFLSK